MQFAADTSILSAFFNDEPADTSLLKKAIRESRLSLPPAVLTELLSYPQITALQRKELLAMPMLTTDESYWARAGQLRFDIIRQGRKAKLGDSLIAQSCIDHDVPLITADNDFEKFAAFGLRLAA